MSSARRTFFAGWSCERSGTAARVGADAFASVQTGRVARRCGRQQKPSQPAAGWGFGSRGVAGTHADTWAAGILQDSGTRWAVHTCRRADMAGSTWLQRKAWSALQNTWSSQPINQSSWFKASEPRKGLLRSRKQRQPPIEPD